MIDIVMLNFNMSNMGIDMLYMYYLLYLMNIYYCKFYILCNLTNNLDNYYPNKQYIIYSPQSYNPPPSYYYTTNNHPHYTNNPHT